MLTHPSPYDDLDQTWRTLQSEALAAQEAEPALGGYLRAHLLNRDGLSDALAHMLAEELAGRHFNDLQIRDVVAASHKEDPAMVAAAHVDLLAILERDPAAASPLAAFLFFKGYHALQAYRVAHHMWRAERTMLALYLQSRIARRFGVDIHPAARIGQGVMMDHAHGIVIGETTVVEDNVSFLHSVTLGGTGKEIGDRHPKIRAGVMIGAGAKILGNIEIGTCARIAAGSVVLASVPPRVTVAGVPARIIGEAGCAAPAEEMDQTLPDV